MSNIEIEIQVKIERVGPLLAFLKKKAVFTGQKRQVDEYFSPIHRDFTKVRPVREWFRIRNADGEYSTNYKNWHPDKDGKSNHCDEFETKIEDLDKFKNILSSLNFKPAVLVDKKRETWQYQDYEVAIDNIKDLGDFVEIEYKGKAKKPDPKKITDDMVMFLKTLGVGKIERNYTGYAFQVLFPGETKFEEV